MRSGVDRSPGSGGSSAGGITRLDFLRTGALGLAGLALAGTAGCGSGGGGSDYPDGDLQIMAPAAPGGGWDQTARAMQKAFTEGGVTDENVEVYNVDGAGGTVGLAQFVNDEAGDPNQLMVMGEVMVGAIHINDTPVQIMEATPIAALITEWEGFVVPSDSEIQSFDELVEVFKRDPQGTSFAGGSAGSTDQILAGMLAREVGVDPSDVNYVAYSGGGEANAAILSGSVVAGVSGLAEFMDQVEAGKMRLLAVSSGERIEGVDAPTLKELGYENLVVPNWRGVMAPPDIEEEDKQAIFGAIEEMRATSVWKKTLEQNDWTDFFKPPEEFASYIRRENERIADLLAEMQLSK